MTVPVTLLSVTLATGTTAGLLLLNAVTMSEPGADSPSLTVKRVVGLSASSITTASGGMALMTGAVLAVSLSVIDTLILVIEPSVIPADGLLIAMVAVSRPSTSASSTMVTVAVPTVPPAGMVIVVDESV